MIRVAAEADLPAIVAIYNASVPERMATADTEPVRWNHGASGSRHIPPPAIRYGSTNATAR